MEKLKKLKPDVNFIDPTTGNVVCTFNTCIDKFDAKTENDVRTPKWNGYKPISYTTHYHACRQCGRKYKSKKDHGNSIDSYESAIASNTETI